RGLTAGSSELARFMEPAVKPRDVGSERVITAKENFVIAETGFGSALNFLLSWSLWLQYAPQNARLHFLSCEKFPLKKADLARCLSLWPQLKNQAQALLTDYPILTPGFHHLSFENGRVNLTLMLGDALSCFNQLLVCGDPMLERSLRTQHVDAWFLDGFAPAKNQAMWSQDLFYTISLLSKPGTTLATFSAASVIKKNLQNAGFAVAKLTGFGRKREMIAARMEDMIVPVKTKFRTTPWFQDKPRMVNQKKAIVLGAGLAGCYTAHALAKRNWQVTLIDAQSDVGCGASGNKQAVLYPRLSAYQSPLTMFMLSAFLFASRSYQRLLAEHPVGELSGILQLALNGKEAASQASLSKWLSAYPELGLLVDATQASELAGIQLQSGGLFIPLSGWLNSQALCKLLTKKNEITCVHNTMVDELVFGEGHWHVNDHSAEVLIIANGYQACQFTQTNYLPLKPIRGQMTSIASDTESKKLRIPVCGSGHILPAHDNTHTIGATYHSGRTDNHCQLEDDQVNLARIKQLSTLILSNRYKDSWAAVRGATTDYLPVVGPAPDASAFKQQFATLESNSKRWLPYAGSYYPGLYLCAGFGSRGLTTIPLAAEWLAAIINQNPSFLPRTLVQALSPARFLQKALIKRI
ncbi:bifunctional tRNA (5-methylaminomethyl-2-thiouridine)(34)-methyltransferase MnmD/FAD-dependent 5-carboxymethylaminomethyl-2-thiouridine(34) oxidoreductase MnmC, partial [Legionella lansingensis]